MKQTVKFNNSFSSVAIKHNELIVSHIFFSIFVRIIEGIKKYVSKNKETERHTFTLKVV